MAAALPARCIITSVDSADMGRVVRLLTRRGVGLVLSGGGARGFAHLGVIRRAARSASAARFLGGASIGAIIAAGVAMDWSDEEMRLRYRRSFVDTNPVNDYTFPLVALTRGRKVSRLLQREFGDALIEDLRQPFFWCERQSDHRHACSSTATAAVAYALRAAVAIPGVMPPVFRGDEMLVDGAAINNLPGRHHAAACARSRDRLRRGRRLQLLRRHAAAADGPPLWRFFARSRSGRRRINIFQS